MIKTLIVALSILALCSCQLFGGNFRARAPQARDPKDSLNQVFAGFWEQGNLTDPVQEINCFDEDTATLTMNFIGDFLKDIAMNDVVNLPIHIKKFQQSFPPATLRCMGNNPETDQLETAYNVSGTPFALLEKQAIQYITLHIKTLKDLASSAYFYYIQGMYKPLGQLFGQVAQQIYAKKAVRGTPDDPLVDLQDLLNGLFEQAHLSDPTTIVKCFNSTSAQITLHFFEDVIGDLATDNYLALVREYQIYKGSLPQELIECVRGNQEVQQVYNAYGFNNETSKTLLQKYLTFNVKHHFQLLNYTKTIDQETEQGNWHDAGIVTGELIQGIIGSGKTSDAPLIKIAEKDWEMIRPIIKKAFNKIH
jgi:hypothetical protein